MQLETERLILREFAADDWQDLNAYTSDPLVVQYMSFGPTTAEQARAYIEGCRTRAQEQPRRLFELAVVLRAEQRVIGNATLELERGDMRNASFAYLLNRQYWGQGYMTEAMRVVFNFGFNQLRLHRLAGLVRYAQPGVGARHGKAGYAPRRAFARVFLEGWRLAR